MKTLIVRLGLLGVVGLAGACATEATYHPYGYGYGGSGTQYLSLDQAQRACINAAQAQGGWRVDRIKHVEQEGDFRARVKMDVRNPAGHAKVTCDYDARTGGAFLR